MPSPLSHEAKFLYELSLGAGMLKKKDLLSALLLLEELGENGEFLRSLKKEEALNLFFLTDKLVLCYFRCEEGGYTRSVLLELSRLVDKGFTRMLIRKYSSGN